MSFFTGLMLLFIGLKLAHIIAWSWFWVLSPITVPLTFALFLLVMGMLASLSR